MGLGYKTLDASVRRKLFSDCRELIQHAQQQAGMETLHCQMFGETITLYLTPTDAFTNQMTFLRPTEAPLNVSITISIIDLQTAGTTIPPPGFSGYHFTQRGDIKGFGADDDYAVFYPELQALLLADAQKGEGFLLLKKKKVFSEYHYNRLFQHALSLLTKHCGKVILPFDKHQFIEFKRFPLFRFDSKNLLDLDKEGEIASGGRELLADNEETLNCWRQFHYLNWLTQCSLPFAGDAETVALKNLLIPAEAVFPALKDYPLLSVIIPACNAAKYLGETLQSVHNQLWPNLEVLVVDDGSTDNTRDVVESCGSKVRYTYQENKGVSAARNKGFGLAKGNYLVFLDADDMLTENSLPLLMIELMQNPEADSVRGFAVPFYEQGRKRVFDSGPDEAFPYYLGAGIYRRGCFDKVGLFDEELGCSEDTDWFTRAEESGAQIFRVSLISLLVRQHADSLSSGRGLDDLHLTEMLKKKIDRRTL